MLSSEGAELRATAAVVALLRSERPPRHLADAIEDLGGPEPVLELEHGLMAAELIAAAMTEVTRWRELGIRLLTVLDADYPENLRGVHDRPPLLFVNGELMPSDSRGVAVIGSRLASPAAVTNARAITRELIASGYTVVSGLAAGIDTAAHSTALEENGRTVAVLGTGVLRSYPPENASLQRQIATRGAVVSQFWPEAGPSRKTFPLRNATMSGLALATVIVEATATSGARVQARHALAHGRPVLLAESLLGQPWAQDLASRAGIHVFATPREVPAVVERVSSTDAPVS
ncbi:MAG TPA: DNA-processing protein DprA [Solirubrobacteraceae bacterium]|nr:DNA-processing protein DprA [Solirubrobacteraceae bacterium]